MWRRHPDLNWGIRILQTLALPLGYVADFWSGLRGSNSLPPPWQGGALPDELKPHIGASRIVPLTPIVCQDFFVTNGNPLPKIRRAPPVAPARALRDHTENGGSGDTAGRRRAACTAWNAPQRRGGRWRNIHSRAGSHSRITAFSRHTPLFTSHTVYGFYRLLSIPTEK